MTWWAPTTSGTASRSACTRRDTGLEGNGADPGTTTDAGERPQEQVVPDGDSDVEVEQVVEWDDNERAVGGDQAGPATS